MNIRRKYHIFTGFLWLALSILGFSSCRDEIEFPSSSWGDEVYDADEVSMPLCVSVAQMQSVDPQSRTWSYVEATPEEKTIADFWFIQYNEAGNRVGLPRYFEMGNDVENDRIDIVMEDFKILVPREDDHEYTCVVLANTHNSNFFNADNRSKFSSLDSLRVYDMYIHNQEDLFDPHPEDQHELKYLLMSGWTKINKDTKEFKVDLIRNTCKVNVKLTNFNYDALVLKYVQWVDMPQGKLFPHGNVEHYIQSDNLDWRMHNEESVFDALLSDEGLSYWIPCNVWLPDDPESTISDTDDSAIVDEDPTHFNIVCRTTEEDDLSLHEFRIYPSRDGKKQFKFESNHFYQITVDLNGIPEKENEFYQKVIFNDLGNSNSFILKQDTKGTNVIDLSRPNIFWGHYDDNLLIQDGTEWVAEVIWQDTDQRVVDFAIYTIGEVSSDRSRYFGNSDTYIPFRTTGTGLGNVIIGVRMKYDGEEDWTKSELDEWCPIEDREYLWSWHLWITDYQPDMVDDPGTLVVGGAFSQVPGGQVIQLGINKAMDRNLGAWAPEVKDPTNPDDIIKTFGLYYQYGRKDPFPYSNPEKKPIYDIDGNLISAFNSQTVSYSVTKRVALVDENGKNLKDEDGNAMYKYIDDDRCERINMMASDDYGSFTLGVSQPYMFWADRYYTGNWASDASETDFICGWYSTQWFADEYMDATMKDLFDPCPTGWVMDSSNSDFDAPALAAIVNFYGQEEYLLWKNYINSDNSDDDPSVKFEDTEENRAMIREYLKLENEFWEDLNGKNVSTSGSPTPFMGCELYYTDRSGTTYFPAAGSRNKYGACDKFHNYMCLPWENTIMRISSFGFNLLRPDTEERKTFDEEEFSTATAMQVRCVRL